MAAAAAQKTQPKPKKERARFVADLAKDGEPLVITVQRMREVFDSETGKKQADPSTGRYIKFKDTRDGLQVYETQDPAEIALLRERSEKHGTFNEVPIPKPPSAEVLAHIMKLTKAKDRDALLKLAEQEEDTHQREDVLEAIGDALDVLA